MTSPQPTPPPPSITGDEPVRWSPSSPGELPPYWMHDYVQGHGDPGLWWPDNRPAPPGQTQPAARHDTNRDEKKPDQSGVGDAQLNVNPADLNNVSDQYAQLQARAAAISPQAVEEVNRIIASHGAMGYPVAVGVVAGLARRQARLQAQTAQFGVYSARFTEHAATYTTEDAEAAARISDIDFGPAAVSTPGAVAG